MVANSLRPIFRDREDFAAGASLSEKMFAALVSSQFLIVLCSPNAAKSEYVNEEIRQFKSMGRGDRVLALIIEGEPGHPECECSRPALKFQVDLAGRITTKMEDPLAADARPHHDGRETSFLKIVAALLGVELDELTQRAEVCRATRYGADKATSSLASLTTTPAAGRTILPQVS